MAATALRQRLAARLAALQPAAMRLAALGRKRTPDGGGDAGSVELTWLSAPGASNNIAQLQLVRPHRRNALTGHMMAALADHVALLLHRTRSLVPTALPSSSSRSRSAQDRISQGLATGMECPPSLSHVLHRVSWHGRASCVVLW